MKTISGQIVSSKPISLSKASSIISKFVSTNNGASHAVRSYLGRASVSFDELVQLHKELKYSSKSGTQLRSRDSKSVAEEYPTQSLDLNQEQPNQSGRRSKVTDLGQEPIGEIEEKKHKKKKRKEKPEFSDVDQDLKHGAEENLGMESERNRVKKKKERGKIVYVEDNECQVGGRMEIEKKKERSQFDNGVGLEETQNGGNIEIDEEKMEVKKKKQKRKNGEVEDGGMDGSEERPGNKKKRRKT